MRGLLGLSLLMWAVGCDDGAAGDPREIDAAPPVVDAGPMDAAPVVDAAPMIEVDAAPPAPTPLPAIIGPAAAANVSTEAGVVEVDLRAGQMRVPLAADLVVDGYAYDEQCPGPLIQARLGDEIVVHFTNDLDEPTTVHWHGLRISDAMDGSPRIQAPVQPGETFTYRFVPPEAGTFWYHPHVRANEQVERGLYGMLVVHEAEPPVFTAERAFLLDDILLNGDQIPAFLQSHPEQMHGRNGNVLLNNGQVEPAIGAATEGSVERWRLVNTANARTMSLSIEGAEVRVIGTDGGLIAEPYALERLQIAVGQRFDLEVRYTAPGTVRLISHVAVVDNGRIVERPFTVQEVGVAPTGEDVVPVELPVVEPPARGRPDQTVFFTFDTVPDPVTGQRWRINGQDMPEAPLFTFEQGEYVRMVLDNRGGPEHPFHLHGQFFEVLPDGRPETEQPGLKDTVLVPGQSRVTIFARLDNPGRWMAHCHILEHAELGMMGEIIVEPR